MLIITPREFSFQLCLDFLKRSPKELLHQLTDDSVTKALHTNSATVVFTVTSLEDALQISFLTEEPHPETKQEVSDYVREWFDLDTDLKPFYRLAEKDSIMRSTRLLRK